MTEMEKPEPRRLEPPPGDWLFKLQGEVLGPVPATEIIERMLSGEVDESTPVALGEGEWVRLQQVESFLPFLYQAKAEIRARQARAEAEAAARRRRLRRNIRIAAVAVAVVIGSFVVSYLLIVFKPWRSEQLLRRWAAKHVPLLAVAVAKAAPASGAAGKVRTAGIDIDQILIDDAPALVGVKASETGRKLAMTKTGSPKAEPNRPPKGKDTPAAAPAPEGGEVASAGALSNEEITGVVYSRSNLSRLYECIRQEARRNPELPPQVVIEFSIANEGRINQVRMDDPKLSDGPLHQCLAQKLALLRFRAYSGQVRNVTIPFNIRQ